jgi:VCBS repeat-containing protein
MGSATRERRTPRRITSVLAILGLVVGTLGLMPAALAKGPNPKIAFVEGAGGSTPNGATVIDGNATFVFTVDRQPNAIISVSCTLTGPSGSVDQPTCGTKVAFTVGLKKGSKITKTYSGLGEGSYTFLVTVILSDGGSATSATRTFTVEFPNTPPIANDDAAEANEDGPAIIIDVLANDTDPDASDTLTVQSIDTTGTSGLVTNNGTNVTYDPNGQFESLNDGETATDTFTYTISDGSGGTDTATVTVTITGVTDDT